MATVVVHTTCQSNEIPSLWDFLPEGVQRESPAKRVRMYFFIIILSNIMIECMVFCVSYILSDGVVVSFKSI